MSHKIYHPLTKFLIAFIVTTLIVGCASREKIVYFQGDLESLESQAANYTPKLQPDDLVSITLYAGDPESLKMFSQIPAYVENSNEYRRQTYLIDESGNIDFPALGKIQLGGKTRIEATEYMKNLLTKYVVNPDVNIQITNFKVTVLGEVAKPGTFSLSNERITILEALGLAGDLTINGVRDNILVVREEAGQKNFYRINLTSTEVFNSPVYFLKQNDVVYVEPNKAQINSSTYSRNTSVIISIASLIITVISVLTR